MPRIVLNDPWWACPYLALLRVRLLLRIGLGMPLSRGEIGVAQERVRRTIDLHRKVSFR